MYQEVLCDNGEVPLAPLASCFSPNLDEHHAFDVLLEAIDDLPAFISEVHRSDPKFIQKYATQTGSSMLDTLLSDSDAFFDDLTAGLVRVGACEEINETSTKLDMDVDSEVGSGAELEDVVVASHPAALTWSISEYRAVMQRDILALALAPHLLRSLYYKFGNARAQVGALVLHRTAHDLPTIKSLMVSFQRLVLYIVVKVFGTSLAGGDVVSLQHVPHKRRQQQGRLLQDCWSERDAQVLVVESSQERLAYSYMACGLKWDPPHVYSLLSKSLPLHVADRVAAVYLFFAWLCRQGSFSVHFQS